MIDAKLKGEGIEDTEEVEPDRSNVVDLMSALRRSLGQTGGDKPAKPKKSAAKPAAKPTARKRG